MSNRTDAPCQDIAEITLQGYARRNVLDQGTTRCWRRIRIKNAIMGCVCTLFGSLMIYWLVRSILSDDNGHSGDSSGRNLRRKDSPLVRLPNDVMPLEYALRIIPVLEEGNFGSIGDVEIQIYCKMPTKRVRLHAHKELMIKDVTIKEYDSSNASKAIGKYIFTAGNDFVDIFLMQILIPGESYVLRIKYVAPLNQRPQGFFRSKYQDRETNTTRWIAVSNFSPDFARKAFPCFDEPSIKAPFRISIGRKFHMRSHSNTIRMFSEEIRDMPGYAWDHYKRTPPMSTYYVAFMVTDFPGYQINVTDRPTHNIFSRKEIQNDTEYIGKLVPTLLRIIQNFTGFSYELEKLDVIIVPQLWYSAMENWGLITFREGNVLVKKNSSVAQYRRFYALIAAHEIGHQWFGNVVTPKWWSDVWLKESFSSFYGTLALSLLEPTWKVSDALAIECRDMFESEASEAAHPLRVNPIMTEAQLRGIFDKTLYVKGNCLLYMLYNVLGETTFLASVRRYVRTYSYRSADQTDLWDAFQEEIESKRPPIAMNLSVRDAMRTWTDQAGFPVLHVKCDNETGLVALAQERFYSYGANGSGKELWDVPLTWTSENERHFDKALPRAWMRQRRITINDTVLHRAIVDDRWILFNVDQTAMYRVNYDTENWRRLTKSFQSLPRGTKSQIFSDAFAMSNADSLEHSVAWDLLEKVKAETDETLWLTIFASLDPIKNRLWQSDAFKLEICQLTETAYDAIAANLTTTDPSSWSRLKVDLTKWTCEAGHATCLQTIRAFVETMREGPSSLNDLPEEFRTWAYCVYVRTSNEERWFELLYDYDDIAVHDRDCLAYALGCHENEELLSGYLSSMLSEKTSNAKHESYLNLALSALARNPRGYNIVMDHWSESMGLDTSSADSFEGYHYFLNVVSAFAYSMDQEENVKWLENLKTTRAEYGDTIDRVIHDVKFNVAWNRRHKNAVMFLGRRNCPVVGAARRIACRDTARRKERARRDSRNIHGRRGKADEKNSSKRI